MSSHSSSVDFRARSERVAFADGLDLLCAWGVLEHTSGSHDSYARREQGEDEALFTVDRRRLALLLRDPAITLESTTLEQLLDETSRYPPTPEGENRARSEQLARRLTEDPALLLSDPRRRRAHVLPRSARADRERRRCRNGLSSRAARRGQRTYRQRSLVHGRAVPDQRDRQAGRAPALRRARGGRPGR